MNLRILGIELKRSAAPWIGVFVLVVPLAFLYFVSGPWEEGATKWTAQWTSMALWTRYPLIFLWPLAVGLGALQGLRDHRSKMSELLTSTPRPARHRAAALAGTTSFALISAFALVVLLGAVLTLTGDASYGHLGWLPISLVGALALAAGAVLGMGVARALPSVLTPPLLVVVTFLFNSFVRFRQTSEDPVPATPAPNAFSLLSPAVADVRETLLTLSASVHLGQTLWLLGMAATGFALLAVATPRARLLALTPLLAGGTLALPLLPADPRDTYVVDRAAAAQVCDGPVCVTTIRQPQLDTLVGPGRETLRLLRGALGDQAPTGIRETAVPRALTGPPERARDAVLLDFGDEVIGKAMFGDAGDKELTRVMVALSIAPVCHSRSGTEGGTVEDAATQSVAAAWVLGDRPRPLDGTWHSASDQEELARPVWKKLVALPAAEQRRRIGAMHAAAVSCSGDDPLAELNGGAYR